jgi:hypothetical protein
MIEVAMFLVGLGVGLSIYGIDLMLFRTEREARELARICIKLLAEQKRKEKESS